MSIRPQTLTYQALIMELFQMGVFPHMHAVKDSIYIVPSHQWLQNQFIPGWVEFARRFYDFEPEGFDCDDFAHGFLYKLRKALKLSGRASLGAVPAAEIQVEQREAWARIPAGGAHALVLMRTDRGWYAIEPQNGIMTMWSVYPNREYIRQDVTTF